MGGLKTQNDWERKKSDWERKVIVPGKNKSIKGRKK